MLDRQKIISIHVLLSSFFLPFLFLMPLSGGLALLKETGEVEKTPAFTINEPLPTETAQMEAFFRDQFQKNELPFEFEYIRVNGNDLTFRPSSRIHYVATRSEGITTVFRADPSLLRRIMEVHKGHGPKFVKWIEIAFGLALLLVTVSGLTLALSVKTYRKLVAIAFITGGLVIFGALV